jgi:hypothetical protein
MNPMVAISVLLCERSFLVFQLFLEASRHLLGGARQKAHIAADGGEVVTHGE